MKKLKVAKFAARIIVMSGTTTVTNSIIRNNVAPANLFQEISVGVASLVIGSMASAATTSHVDSQIDSIVDTWNGTRTPTEETTIPA